MHEDAERCARAVRSKDARFDGWFFTAVLTTRIYCRPSCPAVPPKRENVRFYFPLVTCLVLSVLLSLILWIIRLFRN